MWEGFEGREVSSPSADTICPRTNQSTFLDILHRHGEIREEDVVII